MAIGEIDRPLAEVAGILQSADLTIGNLECALGDTGEPQPKAYTFQAPPNAAQALANAGFDILSLANNHALDYGTESLTQALSLLAAEQIVPIGAGENATTAHAPHIVTINDVRLAFLAYVHVPQEWQGFDTETWTATPTNAGIAWGHPDDISADVTLARQQADVVIVMLHSGFEYVKEPSPPQVAAAHAALQAGAQLVIGHHAHILQGFEFGNNGATIAYGLGNFGF